MWMSPHQFVRNFLKHVVDVEAPGFLGDLGVHDDQQQKIAQLLAKMRVVFRARGFRHFVSLFNQGRQQRFVRLLPVPWATAGRAKLRNDVAELREVIGDLLSVIGHAFSKYSSSLITDYVSR